MADNLTPPFTGTGDATPEVATQDIGGNHHQRVVAYPDMGVFSAGPTASTSPAYTSGDCVGGVLTFTGAARFSGAEGYVVGVTIIDTDNSPDVPALELWVFDRTFTSDGDNTAWDPDDADAANLIAVIPITQWFKSAGGTIANAIGQTMNIAYPFVANGSDLFGQLVTRSANQPGGTTTFTVKLFVQKG